MVEVVNEPRFFGSPKGCIISAIVFQRTHSLEEIKKYSQLPSDVFDKELEEMLENGILRRSIFDDSYWIKNDELFEEYRVYHKNEAVMHLEQHERGDSAQIPRVRESITKWIDDWSKPKDFPLFFSNQHFFLYGRLLDDFSKDLICHAKREVIVSNPFVERCNLSDALFAAARKKVNVKLITRSLNNPLEKYKEEKQEYHDELKKVGVEIIYKNLVHAKIIVVGSEVAVISSMNFQTNSSGGRTWEAGMVSLDKNVINKICKALDYYLVS